MCHAQISLIRHRHGRAEFGVRAGQNRELSVQSEKISTSLLSRLSFLSRFSAWFSVETSIKL